MKKKLSTHDDTPSTPIPSKKIETGAPITEGQVRAPKHADGEKGTPLPKKKMTTPVVNNEGEVRQSKTGGTYVVKEHTDTQPRSKSGDTYPIPDEDVDIYSVDTRIWDRLEGMGGEGPHTHDAYAEKTHTHDTTHNHAGEYSPVGHTHTEQPHDHDGSYAPSGHTHDITHDHDGSYAPDNHTHDFTHDHSEYADAQTLADHLANHPSGGDGSGGSYDDTELRGRVGQNEEDIAALELENNSQNENISNNATAIEGKADANHTHPPQDLTHNHDGEYQPAGDYATNDALTTGLSGKSDTTHTHPDPDLTHDHRGEYWMKWKGTQAQYDALASKNANTLYVVMS